MTVSSLLQSCAQDVDGCVDTTGTDWTVPLLLLIVALIAVVVWRVVSVRRAARRGDRGQ